MKYVYPANEWHSVSVSCEFCWVELRNIFFIVLQPFKFVSFDFRHKLIDYTNISEPMPKI